MGNFGAYLIICGYGLLPLVIGGAFFIAGFRPLRTRRFLRREGATARGRNLSLERPEDLDAGPSAGGFRSSSAHYPVVGWVTPEGRFEEQAEHFELSGFNRKYSVGSEVIVHYDPDRPSRMGIEGYAPVMPWVLMAIGGVILALGAAFVLVITASR